MARLDFNISHPFWFLLLCLLAGALYAFMLYSKAAPWGKKINIAFAVGRFFIVFILCFLLLGPFVKQISNHIEKARYVLAIDNSASLKLAGPQKDLNLLLSKLEVLKTTLSKKNILLDVTALNDAPADKINTIKFDANATNLNAMLDKIGNNYVNRNLAGVILVSDGIFNEGISPDYSNYNFPVYTIGVGDTVPKKDISIKAVNFNKIAYLGNKFPVQVEVGNYGFSGKKINISLRQNNIILESKTLVLGNENQINQVDFLVKANKIGLQHLIVEVAPLQGEFTTQNNYRDLFIEVIEGREKILMLAYSPHPDIKAIKSVIENNENYEFEYHIIGEAKPKFSKYDLIILHQLPDINNAGWAEAQKITGTQIPLLYIVGNQSSMGKLNAVSNMVKVGGFNQTDQVTAAYNQQFSSFIFSEDKAAFLQKMPPLSVPLRRL